MSGFQLVRPRLARRFFWVMLGTLVAIFTITYWYSVPLIKQTVFDIERDASRLVLDNVVEIAGRMHDNVEDYRRQALKARQEQLRVVVELAGSFLHQQLEQARRDGVSAVEARRNAFEALRSFSYGNHDYIWVADEAGYLLSHPDARYHHHLVAELAGPPGLQAQPDIVSRAIRDGEGFYRYRWNRLEKAEVLEKLSFVHHYPEWGLVVGSGVYLDDLEQAVGARRKQALEELRQALQGIRVARTGYLYVFDSHNRMLIHPNRAIDGTDIRDLLNPLSENYIAEDLKRVADTGQELKYLWDKPEEPGNYVYEKLSLVRYLKAFDWYICSSVYTEELLRSSDTLSRRLLLLAGLTLLVSLMLAGFFIKRITRPLEQLVDTARRVSAGDLSARSGISTGDEIGTLASSFDGMVTQLKGNIDDLDTKVRRRTEELLATSARAQRMQAVGQLAGGLAHDFNNLLSIILGNLLLARERHLPDAGGLADYLDPAIHAARRGADITHRLLAFSRRETLEPEQVPIAVLVREVMHLLTSSLPDNIRLEEAVREADLMVHVDPGYLENALVNLALNSRDAMPQGGCICFGIDRVQAPPEGYDEPVAAGTYVRLTIRDSGTGFSTDARVHALEPFYTTKLNGLNSGLGLSMVYGFVKQSRGYLRIGNVPPPESGACVTLLLPLARSPVDDKAHLSPVCQEILPEQALQGKLLLLVEDNDGVRAVVREQLLGLGVYVVEAGTAGVARQLIDELPALDGMVSDILLNAGEDGRELALRLYRRNPRSIILLISGYASEQQPVQGGGERPFPLLRKPFDRAALGQALWRALHHEEEHE
ncbi:MAG TPA: cache domain-containing protein [Thiolinea sp.]|nr:cache domain-containing protein [Thiolinea sp.]